MNINEIESCAKKNIKIDCQSLPDLYAYDLLKRLYNDFRNGKITKQQGNAEKMRIIKLYNKYKSDNFLIVELQKYFGKKVKIKYQYSNDGYIQGTLYSINLKSEKNTYSATIKTESGSLIETKMEEIIYG